MHRPSRLPCEVSRSSRSFIAPGSNFPLPQILCAQNPPQVTFKDAAQDIPLELQEQQHAVSARRRTEIAHLEARHAPYAYPPHRRRDLRLVSSSRRHGRPWESRRDGIKDLAGGFDIVGHLTEGARQFVGRRARFPIVPRRTTWVRPDPTSRPSLVTSKSREGPSRRPCLR